MNESLKLYMSGNRWKKGRVRVLKEFADTRFTHLFISLHLTKVNYGFTIGNKLIKMSL